MVFQTFVINDVLEFWDESLKCVGVSWVGVGLYQEGHGLNIWTIKGEGKQRIFILKLLLNIVCIFKRKFVCTVS